MANEMIIYDSYAAGQRPSSRASNIRGWAEEIISLPRRNNHGRFTKEHAITFGQMARQNSEGAVVGALAAYVERKTGSLDHFIATDGAAAVVANIAGLVASGNEASRDLVNVGSNFTTLYAYRSVKKLLDSINASSNIAGEKTEANDSIQELAKQL